VTGNATIIADPNDSGVEPLIYDSGNTSNLSVDTQVGDGGDGDATVHVGLISGNGTTTVSGTGLLVAGNFSQTALTNNGVVEIDGTGVIGQLTGSGNLTVGNGTSDNTVQLAAAATSDGFNNAQGSVTIGVGSTLDITDSILLLNYGNGSTPLAVVQAAVAYGAGVSGASGAYGSIMSSTANAGKAGKYTVGYADSTEVTSIPSGNVELMYTLSGDANLDGVVNFNDYSTLQNNYDKSGTDWSQGDFNHDGVVNFNDFSMLQNNYDQTVTSADAVTPASGDLSQSATATTPAAQSVAEPVYTLYTPAITNLFSSNQNISAADATSWLQQ